MQNKFWILKPPPSPLVVVFFFFLLIEIFQKVGPPPPPLTKIPGSAPVHLCIILNKSIVVNIFSRKRSKLTIKYQFPSIILRWSVNVWCYWIWILEDQGYRQTCAPLLKLEGAYVSPPSLALDLNPFRDVWHRQGHLCPPPSQKLGGARVPSFRGSSLACYKFRDVWHRPGHLCPLPLKLWEGHVLPSPFPLLIHSEMFHRLGHLCPLLKSSEGHVSSPFADQICLTLAGSPNSHLWLIN